MKHVLVTGANGFIGIAICNLLLDKGYRVSGAIRRRSGLVTIKHRFFNSIEIENIETESNWDKVLKDVDVIVHLAAMCHVMGKTSISMQEAFSRVNKHGSLRLARAAVISNVQRLIYISSIKVNGDKTLAEPFTENAPCSPADPYAISKYEAECGLREIANNTGIELVILRPPLVYGPGVKGNFLKLLSLVNSGIPLPLANTYNKRSLIALDNLADIIFCCVDHVSASGETFVVADNEMLSTSDLIKRIAKALNRPSRLFPLPGSLMRWIAKPLKNDQAVSRLVDSLSINTTKVNTLLGWRAPYSVDDSLYQTAQWFLENPEVHHRHH